MPNKSAGGPFEPEVPEPNKKPRHLLEPNKKPHHLLQLSSNECLGAMTTVIRRALAAVFLITYDTRSLV